MPAYYDNILYVLRLSPPNQDRGLGWATGPSDPPGQPHDQVIDPQTGFMTATFHWLLNPASPAIGPDTTENVTENMQSGVWRHFKFYNQENTGYWLITDLDYIINVAVLRGLASFADNMASNPLVPKIGELIPGT